MMVTAFDLTCTLEHPVPTSTDIGQTTPVVDDDSDHTPRRDANIPNTKTGKEPSPPLPATTLTSPNTLAIALPPSAGDTTREATHIEPDQEILTQLRLATTDERELQIISATIEV